MRTKSVIQLPFSLLIINECYNVIDFTVEVDVDDFNIIQPSLLQQLRTILDQYPDDGQILKVHFSNILIRLRNKLLK